MSIPYGAAPESVDPKAGAMHGPDLMDHPAAPSPPVTRRIARVVSHRPNGRTIVGALLVSVAALMTYLAVAGAGATDLRSAIVADRDIAIGDRLDASALRTIMIDAGSPLAGHTFADPTALVGAVALAPVTEGELVQRGAVLTGGASTPTREFSFPVDRDRALNGDLRSGERVDVLATFGTGSDATTTVLARDATVVRIADARSGTLGSSAKLIITLALPSADQLLDAVHAAQTADITVVRSTLAGDTTGSRALATGPLARGVVGR